MYFASHFRAYLIGKALEVHMSHHSLQWHHKFKEPEGRVSWRLEELMEWNARSDAIHNCAIKRAFFLATWSELGIASRKAETVDEQAPDPHTSRQLEGKGKPTDREMGTTMADEKTLWNR